MVSEAPADARDSILEYKLVDCNCTLSPLFVYCFEVIQVYHQIVVYNRICSMVCKWLYSAPTILIPDTYICGCRAECRRVDGLGRRNYILLCKLASNMGSVE